MCDTAGGERIACRDRVLHDVSHEVYEDQEQGDGGGSGINAGGLASLVVDAGAGSAKAAGASPALTRTLGRAGAIVTFASTAGSEYQTDVKDSTAKRLVNAGGKGLVSVVTTAGTGTLLLELVSCPETAGLTCAIAVGTGVAGLSSLAGSVTSSAYDWLFG
jgi:hypothetical protein